MTDKPEKPNPTPTPRWACEMLTPEELASLRQEAKETAKWYQETFAHLRPKTEKDT